MSELGSLTGNVVGSAVEVFRQCFVFGVVVVVVVVVVCVCVVDVAALKKLRLSRLWGRGRWVVDGMEGEGGGGSALCAQLLRPGWNTSRPGMLMRSARVEVGSIGPRQDVFGDSWALNKAKEQTVCGVRYSTPLPTHPPLTHHHPTLGPLHCLFGDNSALNKRGKQTSRGACGAVSPASFQFSSGWCLCARKSPYALHQQAWTYIYIRLWP